MTERYPFFREEDEQTLAVIGEEAADADMEGIYQKPYAILTQKHLYCKNERGELHHRHLRDSFGGDNASGAEPIPVGGGGVLAVVICAVMLNSYRHERIYMAQVVIDSCKASLSYYEEKTTAYENAQKQLKQAKKAREEIRVIQKNRHLNEAERLELDELNKEIVRHDEIMFWIAYTRARSYKGINNKGKEDKG